MTVNDIIRGDQLMLFDASGNSIGGATNHTLTITPDTTDISCKDAGIWGWKKTTKINWEIQSENLFLESPYSGYVDSLINDQELTVFFGEAANYAESGSTSGYSRTASGLLYTGKVKITSLTLNAQAGDNATYSVTFTGVGALTKVGMGGSGSGDQGDVTT